MSAANFTVDTEALGSAAQVVRRACMDLAILSTTQGRLGPHEAGSADVARALDRMNDDWTFGRQRTADTLESVMRVLESAQQSYEETETGLVQGLSGGDGS